jgi:hypothetical protein
MDGRTCFVASEIGRDAYYIGMSAPQMIEVMSHV